MEHSEVFHSRFEKFENKKNKLKKEYEREIYFCA